MTIIDRYLLRQFLQVFVICFISLNGLYVVFDAFGNLDEFMEYADEKGNLLGCMAEFYAYRSLFFFDRTCAVLAMVAAMFTITWLERHSELTALQAAGVSRARLAAPLVIAAACIVLLAALNREVVIPQAREQLAKNPKDLLGNLAQELRPRYDNRTEILFRGKQLFANEQRINEPNFLLPPQLSVYGKQLVAAEAYYKPPTGDRPGGYLLTQLMQPTDTDAKSSLALGTERVLLFPGDTPWLGQRECFVVSEVSFEQLSGGQGWKQFSSTWDLVSGLRNRSLDFGADVRVAIHARIVQPLLDLTLFFLGLPLVLGRETRNVFMAIGLCGAVVGGFMLLVIGAQAMGSVYLLDPALAAWLPLMLSVPVAVFMSHRVVS